MMLLVNSHKNMQKLLNDCFAPLDLKCAAAFCLRLIKNSENGLSASELSSMSGYDKALISRTCSELKERELIVRNPEDSGIIRGYRFILTEKGNEIIGQMDVAISEITQKLTHGISKESLEIFYNTAAQMAENVIGLSK